MAAGHGPLSGVRAAGALSPAPLPPARVPAPRRQAEPLIGLLVVAVFALLGLFVVLPLARVLAAGFVHNGAVSLDSWRALLGSNVVAVPLRNSLLLAATVAVTGTAVGFACAWVLVMVRPRGSAVFRTLAMLPMIAPPFMIALAAIMLFGRNGVITRNVLLPLIGANVPEIYGYGGLVLVQTLTFFPLSMLLLVGTLGALDPSLEAAAQNQGATPARAFRDIVLPLAVPGILASMLLLFVESLADFGNPLVLGGDFRVLSVAAFLRITGEFDTAGGAVLATVLLVPALVAFLVQRALAERTAFATVTGRPAVERRAATSGAARSAAAAIAVAVTATVMLFFDIVVYGSLVEVWGVGGGLTLRNYADVAYGAGGALADSLLLAAVATPLAGIFGMATAWLLVRRRFAGRGAMSTLAMLMFAAPGTVVGIGYILAFNSPPLQLTGTALIIVLLFVFRSAPVGIEAGVSALRQVDRVLEEGSASLGARPLVTFRRVVLPLIAPAFFTGLAHAFVRSMTAISAVIFVVSGRWNLATVAVLGYVENADLSRAAALSLVVTAIVALVLVAMHVAVNRMGGTRWASN